MSDDPQQKRRRLGRGLSALLGDESPSQSDGVGDESTGVGNGPPRSLPIAQLDPNPYQPRQDFDQNALEELTESVRRNGILQPILVRPNPQVEGRYQIVAGERRWRAAQAAQLHELPIVIRDLTNRDALEIALVENLQRQDLSPLEEAEGYRNLISEFSHTQEDLAAVIGKSRSHIANTMRLLQLPDEIKDMLAKKLLTAGHARALLTSDNPVALAEQVVLKGLNVRETERLAQDQADVNQEDKTSRSKTEPRSLTVKDADTLALERDISNSLGLAVSIDFKGRGGSITLTYESLAQLDDIVSRLTRPNIPTQERDAVDGLVSIADF